MEAEEYPALTFPPKVTLNTNEYEGLRVLVVDDNIAAADSLARLLCALGVTATSVYGGKDAFSYLEKKAVDLMFLDIGMPEITGYEVVSHLRENGFPTLPVLALTGYGLETDKQRSKEAGFTGHLIKPIGLSELLQILSTITKQFVPAI